MTFETSGKTNELQATWYPMSGIVAFSDGYNAKATSWVKAVKTAKLRGATITDLLGRWKA